jgi:hypothetical protein
MSSYSYPRNSQRLTQKEKDANDKQWYKDQADLLDSHSLGENSFVGYGGVSEYRRKKVNYDLFNNIINLRDFEYVCKPFGAEAGELPANLTNRDIISGKLKVLLGMEMKMPFSWRVVAVNEEATTRKEQEETAKIRDFVANQIMKPIRASVERKYAEQSKGRELTEEELMEVESAVEKETSSMTPDEVRRYMVREHQDPAEVMSHQILEYVMQKQRVAEKFNKGWKHSLISGEEIYWIGIINGEPTMKVINPLFFEYDKSPDTDYIEDGEWAVCEYRMTPSEVVATLGSFLKNDEIDRIYSVRDNTGSMIYDSDFTFNTDKANEPYTISVRHMVWKSLRKIGFLTYLDRNGEEQMDIVNEEYKLNKERGDVKVKWEWIPEVHECYKLMSDIYVACRPVAGQFKDLNNLYECKLPYYGAACDSLNSPTTSPMDRGKSYQYFYNIIVYRTELLMASDKGKILAANINAIPKSAGINIEQWQYFLEANKIAWFNPNEEGNRGNGDVTNLVKEIDMSLASQINNYIQLAEYIERRCGEAIGVNKQMEGAIGPNEAVSNTRQNITQSSHIIQPYFELHNCVKRNVITGLLETAKVAYSEGSSNKILSYVLDDMSIRTLTVDQGMLSASTLGIFVSNSSKAYDAKMAVENLAQAALQNQQINIADIIKIIRSESITEAEEMLEAAQQREGERAAAIEQQKIQSQEELEAKKMAFRKEEMKHEKELVVLKEEERRKTEIQKQAIFSTGFDENKDRDADGTPDVLEVAKFGVDADIKARKQTLDEEKFNHQKKVDEESLKLEAEKVRNAKNKKST